MKIYVQRTAKKAAYTIGKLYVDGKYYCDTLEDKDRGLHQNFSLETNKKLKVYGETAIPMGTYLVQIHHWTKYNIDVPLLVNVPAFTGILIHNGTTEKNTEGCILVGKNTSVGRLTDGKKYMVGLTDLVKAAIKKGERVMITVSDIPQLKASEDNFMVPKSIV